MINPCLWMLQDIEKIKVAYLVTYARELDSSGIEALVKKPHTLRRLTFLRTIAPSRLIKRFDKQKLWKEYETFVNHCRSLRAKRAGSKRIEKRIEFHFLENRIYPLNYQNFIETIAKLFFKRLSLNVYMTSTHMFQTKKYYVSTSFNFKVINVNGRVKVKL